MSCLDILVRDCWDRLPFSNLTFSASHYLKKHLIRPLKGHYSTILANIPPVGLSKRYRDNMIYVTGEPVTSTVLPDLRHLKPFSYVPVLNVSTYWSVFPPTLGLSTHGPGVELSRGFTPKTRTRTVSEPSLPNTIVELKKSFLGCA